MLTRSWFASTKCGKDAGSRHSRSYGGDRGRRSAPRDRGPEAGGHLLEGHYPASASVPARSFSASLSFVSSSRWQAWKWSESSLTGASKGSVVLQTSITYGQRGWNRQPLGGFRSEGGWPVIWTRRSTSASSRGSEPRRPHV